MSVLAPAWALGAQALDGQGDTHILDGIHFRVVTDPFLGLPQRPLIVYRWNLGNSTKNRGTRNDVIWVDSFGTVLTTPFELSPGNPVTGYLPVGATSRCVWLRVNGQAKRVRIRDNAPDHADLAPTAPGVGAVLDRNSLAAILGRRVATMPTAALEVNSSLLGARDLRRDILDLSRFLPNLDLLQGKIRVDAWKSTEYGLQTIGARDKPPYDIGASEIHGVVVSGRGTIRGISWLDWHRMNFDKMTPWRFMGLPVESADRYEGLANAGSESKGRVLHGAPRRFGMHDAPASANPASTPVAASSDEAARLNSLAPDVDKLLTPLLEDGDVQASLIATDVQSGSLPPDTTVSEVAYSPLSSLLLGAADPTIARYLGFLDRDEAPPGEEGDIIAYIIRGFWAADVKALLNKEQIWKWPGLQLASGGLVSATNPPAEPGLPFSIPRTATVQVEPTDDVGGDETRDIQLFDWYVPAVTTFGAPLLPPWKPETGPQIAPSEPPSPDGQGHWNTDILPPDARRNVELPVSELTPGANLAFARDENGSIKGLNRRFDVNGSSVPDRAHGILPTLPSSASSPSEGRLNDRLAPADACKYRVAQHDWFGRWSHWTGQSVPEKERPGPPEPVLAGEYVRSSLPDPMHSNPLWGTLTVRCRLPNAESLPPAARLLATLRISGNVDGNPITPVDVAVPAAWQSNSSGVFTTLATTITPPAGVIDRGENVEAVLRAVLIDTDGELSDPSADEEIHCVDPRPPEPVVIDPTLKYSARPDATGRARVTLTWPVSGGQKRFRVYFCDETRLLERLGRMAAGQDPVQVPDSTYTPSTAERTAANALLTAHSGAGDDPAQRGAAFTDAGRPANILRPWFQQLTGEPLEAGTGVTSMSFQHELSGSLRTLAFYRVVSVSENNVESAFADAPLVPFGVPNLGGPPRPMLEVVKVASDDPDPLATGSVRLKVRLIRGTQPPGMLRLRRSSVQSDDACRMAVAREMAVTAPMPASISTPWEFTIDDDGAWVHDTAARLRPFTRYSWRVEVQSPTLPGSTVDGEWSPSSPAASTLLLPDPPEPPVSDSLSQSGNVVTVTWTHPDPLEGGAMGGYRFDVYRLAPGRGQREERVGSVYAEEPVDTSGRYFIQEDFGSDSPPVGTTYRVVVLDPAGRLSTPSAILTLT